MTEIKNQNIKTRILNLEFKYSNLFRISNFEFRIFAKRGGFAALTSVLVFATISVVMIGAFTAVTFREVQITRAFAHSVKSYYAAEAGVEDAIYRFVSGKETASSEIFSLGTATATVSITGFSFEKTIVAEAAESGTYYRAVESAIAIQGTPAGFSYGVQAGTGGFALGQNSEVSGNVFSNGSITGAGENKSTITGTAQAAGTSTIEDIRVDMAAYAWSFDDCSVGGGAYYVTLMTNCPAASTTMLGQGLATAEFPISTSDIDDWKADAAAGGALAGYSLGNSKSGSLGPKKINGNITLGNGAELTLDGTVWVTGTIQFGNNSIIRLAPGYGFNSGVLVVDGAMVFGNDASLRGSGQGSSYLILAATFGPGVAIDVSNNATSSILYAPNGMIGINNNVEILEAIAYGITTGNNASITYDQGLLNVNFTSGPTAQWAVKSWREVE